MRPSRRFSLHESKKNFAGGDAAASALDKVQEGPSAVKLAAVPVSERPAGWLLRPLGRLLELGCVFRRERFPLSRHVVQLLAVLRVAHLMRDFAALDRTVEILQALTHRYLSPHRCLASAWFAMSARTHQRLRALPPDSRFPPKTTQLIGDFAAPVRPRGVLQALAQ